MQARHVVSLVSVLAVAAACGESSTSPTGKLQADEAAAVALYFDTMAASSVASSGALAARTPGATGGAGFSATMAPVSLTVESTILCPRGGETHLSFALTGQVDPQTNSLDVDLTGTHAPAACAFPSKELTITITGTPGLTSTAHLSMVNGAPSGVQTSSTTGSFDWSTSDGRSGHCEVAYTTEVDFAAGTVKVDGNFCGTTIHLSGSRMGQG